MSGYHIGYGVQPKEKPRHRGRGRKGKKPTKAARTMLAKRFTQPRKGR